MVAYLDLWIDEGDLVLDSVDNPQLLDGLASIAQDIKHLVMESGLLVELIGQRGAQNQQSTFMDIVVLIETDQRIEPGTVDIAVLPGDIYSVRAGTLQNETFDFSLN